MTQGTPFLVLGWRRVSRANFFTLERRYIIGHGSDWAVRDVVAHPGSVTVVPWDGHHVFLIRQYRPAIGRYLLELPAGKLDVAGEDPEAAAIRECAEEVGLLPGRVTLLHSALASPGFTDERSLVYLAQNLEEVGIDRHGIEEESAEIIGLTPTEIEERLPSIEDATTLIGLYAFLRSA